MDKWILDLIFKFSGYGIAIYVIITTIIAAFLSFLIGLERHLKGEPAGISTHILLAIGCSLLMTISIWAISVADGSIDFVNGTLSNNGLNYDAARIAAGVVTGLGFLGGGVIIKDKATVKGLSTASTLWICAAIGLACGAGFVLEALVATIVTLILLLLLNIVIPRINARAPSIEVVCKNNYPFVSEIREFSEKNSILFKNIKVVECNENETKAILSFGFKTEKNLLQYLCNQFNNIEEIVSITICEKKRK